MMSVFALAARVVVFTDASLRSTTAAVTVTPSPSKFPADALGHRDLLPLCDEKIFTQNVNHFVGNGGDATFEQRYFVCGKQLFNKDNGTIFFYAGNEGDVLLYLNNTGLMWENAEAFNALLVFAEHRYFGKSVPFGDAAAEHMEVLGSAQALADYAVLIELIQHDLDADVPVIGFGGSYGGMLAAWFRLKYPHLMAGAIAGSAPLLHFLNDPDHPVDKEAFQRIVTYDMSPAAGASDNCASNVRKAFSALLQSEDDIHALVDATADVFGNVVKAYPVRAACEFLVPDFGDGDRAVLTGLRHAVGVYFNATQDASCLYDQAAINVDLRNLGEYIKCWELYMPVSSDGVHDVFPLQPANFTADDKRCVDTWGIHLRPTWPETQYGGFKALKQASNIVFSNGNYDPWSRTGVLTDLSDLVVAVINDGGGHHVDLFFSHPMDPPSLTEARKLEKQHMRKWIKEFYDRKAVA